MTDKPQRKNEATNPSRIRPKRLTSKTEREQKKKLFPISQTIF